jgi:hypothetical protein
MRMAFLMLAAVAYLGLVACVTVTPREISEATFSPLPENYQETVKASINSLLKDPYTAVYIFGTPRRGFIQDGFLRGNAKHFGYIIPVGVNARNSYGGYTGTQQYYMLFTKDKFFDITRSFRAGMAEFLE